MDVLFVDGLTKNSACIHLCNYTIKVRRCLETICAVDVVLHLQHESGPTEDLGQTLFPDRSFLQDDHSLLIHKLGTMFYCAESTVSVIQMCQQPLQACSKPDNLFRVRQDHIQLLVILFYFVTYIFMAHQNILQLNLTYLRLYICLIYFNSELR